ncbi:MAG: 2-oxoisovalerate dehydrogenase component beta subunit [Frankiaceae bacterium]|nr:2-oxoisovalerate dehydrogenase component beta subunit [Frankiaceae bacterium]
MTVTMAKAINTGLRRAMDQDGSVLLMGQDIGALGGVFRITDGLWKDFGDSRVIDTPLGESGIVGAAIGLAMRGYRPVCEIQFDGFVFPAFDQITTQLAKMRYRTAGRVALPVTIRIPYGGGIGAVEHHSESPEAYFAHTPGLRVVTFASSQDAYDVTRSAIASDDPVIVLEPKRRYWDKSPLEIREEVLPLPLATIAHAGSDVTLVCYGPTVRTCLSVAQVAADEGRSVEVVDLRSLSPWDEDTVLDSVRRTGRCIVVHEASVSGGLGAEIAARVSERAFYMLEAPVLRVGGFHTPYPVSRIEDEYLPDLDRILDAIDRSFAF